jgi:hypothetical protein
MHLRRGALAAAILIGSATLAAAADESCSPVRAGVKILRSKNASDIHPNWRPPNQIGMAWSLIEVRHEGMFLSGQLVSPRGGTLPGRVYVLADEWECE